MVTHRVLEHVVRLVQNGFVVGLLSDKHDVPVCLELLLHLRMGLRRYDIEVRANAASPGDSRSFGSCPGGCVKGRGCWVVWFLEETHPLQRCKHMCCRLAGEEYGGVGWCADTRTVQRKGPPSPDCSAPIPPLS